MKNSWTYCLLITLLYVHLNFIVADEPKRFTIEVPDEISCRKGAGPHSVCGRNVIFPSPRVGRRSESVAFTRSQRVFGLVKLPRIGRSEPPTATAANREDEAWPYARPGFQDNAAFSASRARGLAEKEEDSRSLQSYLLARKQDRNTPWTFFLVAPNYGKSEEEEEENGDNFAPRLGNEIPLDENY